jgi:RecB family exonuclease
VVVKNEAEILQANKTTFRPDRIVYLPTRTIIVDYKTGKESTKHHEQVDNYAALLEEMGEVNVEKYLVYTDDLRVVKV